MLFTQLICTCISILYDFTRVSCSRFNFISSVHLTCQLFYVGSLNERSLNERSLNKSACVFCFCSYAKTCNKHFLIFKRHRFSFGKAQSSSFFFAQSQDNFGFSNTLILFLMVRADKSLPRNFAARPLNKRKKASYATRAATKFRIRIRLPNHVQPLLLLLLFDWCEHESHSSKYQKKVLRITTTDLGPRVFRAKSSPFPIISTIIRGQPKPTVGYIRFSFNLKLTSFTHTYTFWLIYVSSYSEVVCNFFFFFFWHAQMNFDFHLWLVIKNLFYMVRSV